MVFVAGIGGVFAFDTEYFNPGTKIELWEQKGQASEMP